jgi:hypothetical protein
MSVQIVNQLWNPIKFICLSTDTKPLKADAGTRLYVTDTPGHFIFDGASWQVYKEATAITP